MSTSHIPADIDDALVRAHVEGWHQFTRFVTAGIIAMVLLLMMFVVHFSVGWGFAMFLLVVSYVGLIFALIVGKI